MVESPFKKRFPLIKHLVDINELFNNLAHRPSWKEVHQAGLIAEAVVTDG